MLGGKLCTVLPVSLIAVIFLGIVACRDVDARNTAEVAQGKGKLGRGAKLVKNKGFNFVFLEKSFSIINFLLSFVSLDSLFAIIELNVPMMILTKTTPKTIHIILNTFSISL